MNADRIRPVGQVAAELGISAETLRYYERHRVLPAPSRDAAGRRVYRDSDVHLIEVLLHLRDTGMPLATIAEFTRHVARDPDGVPERLALLRQHRAHVLKQLEQLSQSLAVIDQKITDYGRRARNSGLADPIDRP
ncbi:MerR family transcriptional regulator [Saxibacter everestensis]|uniref:MerR family transcriptional regulator n=1 Tax=Saxibacter everestensis TaxID=2909229 RepID=A0ABY8QNJ6_9MICO|nr:MerR family transcriptional regulator [Brevibacteriaceae bacterium ZFBP1038]